MNNEKIKVRNTDSGQLIEVVVFSKRAEAIEVVLGRAYNVNARSPRRATAWPARSWEREIVYERSREQVQADIDRLDPRLKKSR